VHVGWFARYCSKLRLVNVSDTDDVSLKKNIICINNQLYILCYSTPALRVRMQFDTFKLIRFHD